MAVAGGKSDIKLTRNNSYLALVGKLWRVYCEELGANWPCYKCTALCGITMLTVMLCCASVTFYVYHPRSIFLAPEKALQWRHNGRDSVSNHQPHHCLRAGNYRGPVNSPQKWPVTRKMFPFDDVIMYNDIPSGPLKPPRRAWVNWSHHFHRNSPCDYKKTKCGTIVYILYAVCFCIFEYF